MEKVVVEMTTDTYAKGYSKAEELLENVDFKKFLKDHMLNLPVESFEGFTDGMCDGFDSVLFDIEQELK